MVSKKLIHTIEDLRKLQLLAADCPDDVGILTLDGRNIADAKSLLSLFSLNFSKPVLIVTENLEFYKMIGDIGENVPLD